MPITDHQRESRSRHIGGSDVPAIMGVSPWGTVWDVWAEKLGMIEPLEPNDQMEAGTHFEDGVLTWAEKRLGTLRRNQYRSYPEAYLGCNIDALAMDDERRPVEVKTGGLFGPVVGEWGEPGTDEVPDHVIVQCHAHMICTSADLCHVAAFLGGRGFLLYEIKRDADIAGMIVERCREFWEVNVMGNHEPDAAPTYDVARRMKRTPNKSVCLKPFLLREWMELRDKAKAATEAEEVARAQILAAMGDAEEATFEERPEAIRFMNVTQHRKATEAKEVTFRTWKLLKGTAK